MDNICLATIRETTGKSRLEVWLTDEVIDNLRSGAHIDTTVTLHPAAPIQVRLIVCDSDAFRAKLFELPDGPLFIQVASEIWDLLDAGGVMVADLTVIKVGLRKFTDYEEMQRWIWKSTDENTLFADIGSAPSDRLVFQINGLGVGQNGLDSLFSDSC